MVKFRKSIAMLLAIALMISCFSLSAIAADDGGTYGVARAHTHSNVLYHATCNGRTQTWYYRCSEPSCSHAYTTTNTCPAGPHSGPCPALPV